jgi:hypothetical protein
LRAFIKEQNVGKLNFTSFLAIILLLTVCVGYLFIWSYYRELKAEIEKIKADYYYLEKEKASHWDCQLNLKNN